LDDEKIFALVDKPPIVQSRGEPPSVHGLYPFPKRERWFVLLVDPRKADQILAFQRLYNFNDKQQVFLRFRAPNNRGVYTYEIHAKCDSYVGCDVVRTFKMRVDSPPPEITKDTEPTPAQPQEQTEEDSPKWYYLWNNTFWEFLLTLIILGLIGLFVLDWLQQRGYWQIYFQPTMDRISVFTAPVVAVVYPYVEPVIRWLDKVTTRTFPHIPRTSKNATQNESTEANSDSSDSTEEGTKTDASKTEEGTKTEDGSKTQEGTTGESKNSEQEQGDFDDKRKSRSRRNRPKTEL